jgi:RNA polymerase sigma-54 factor
MKPSLQVRLSQHLALTPQLQQSIRLLQLSTLELQQEVEQMLDQNPFLETEEEPAAGEAAVERAAPAEPFSEAPAEAVAEREEATFEGGDDPGGIDGTDFGTMERRDWENGTEGDDFDGIRELPSASAAPASNSDDEQEAQDRTAAAPSLQDHLRGQLALMRLSAEDRVALWTLIESLDADGYLADPLTEIAERLADANDTQDREDLLERLQCALKWLQSLDPAGVGARTLAECLTLQLRTTPDTAARTLAIHICGQHLDLLAKREIKKLCAATNADEALLREARELIVHCDPKPGRAFGRNDATVVVPDVIVQRAGRVWKVQLNPDVMPKLRINDLYAQAIRGQRNGTGAGLNARLQEARWFVKNIQQRFDTIVRVSQAIVERQKGFLTHGAIAMKPLVLREIADELGLHESTISRVTTAKYMSTPYGTYELKYFFGSSLSTDAGGNASSTAVRALLRQLVAAEDPKTPLSDGQLAQMLSEQGIQVARRTVAKYREALKIAPANLRRTM